MATTAPNVLTSEMQTKLSSDAFVVSTGILLCFFCTDSPLFYPVLLGAHNFVEAYYHNLNSTSKNLDQFYVDSNAKYTTAQVKAQLVINGAAVGGPAAYLALVEAQGADFRYEVEAYDTHVINPSFAIAMPETGMQPKSSIMVQVTGKVNFGKGRDVFRKSFSEVFVLVPNWDAFSRNAPKNVRRFLVLSQNYRTLMD
ncbi:Nuclear transport factor 2 domain containing protein [Ceratocystis lukuohia]|uniref:Nuclear transport factor 2 domain containing protein n=1 Tax=Ceratocystis lukuohia TaxID=2019550 RepID=A0ABR4MHS2_9PEZI